MRFMMKNIINVFLLCFLFSSVVVFYVGCKKETPAEKAEKEIKKALDGAKEKLKDLTD